MTRTEIEEALRQMGQMEVEEAWICVERGRVYVMHSAPGPDSQDELLVTEGWLRDQLANGW